MEKRKLEKAISICDKDKATLEEIANGCAGICRASFGPRGKEKSDGYISCSLTKGSKLLALCLWEKTLPEGYFRKTAHIVTDKAGMMFLKATIDYGLRK